MKRVVLVFISVLILSANASGQWYNKYYPGRSLSELGNTELLVLNEKALSMRNTGVGIFIGGLIVSGAGMSTVMIAGIIDFIPFITTGEGVVPPGVYDFGVGFMIGGLAVLVIGVPIWITGGARVKEIKKLPNFTGPNGSLAIKPSFQFIHGQTSIAPGLSLSIRF